MWGLFERRFRSILQRLERHRSTLELESSSLHFADMKKAREESLQQLKQYEEQRQANMVDEVFRWLLADTTDQEETLHYLADQCLSGTCNWFFQERCIADWIDTKEDTSQGSIIWLKGIPGSGMITSKPVRFFSHKLGWADLLTTLLT
jgi:hypothetical protein